MSKVGTLNPVTKGAYQELHGEIKTLKFQMKIKLIPDLLKKSDNSPDYIICAIGPDGGDIPVGGAWKKKKSQIGDVNLEFLSLTIDDPSFDSSFNIAAFKNNEGGWDITWRRRQQGQSQSETTSAA